MWCLISMLAKKTTEEEVDEIEIECAGLKGTF